MTTELRDDPEISAARRIEARKALHDRLDVFLDRVAYGHFVVKKSDRSVLIEEMRQDKKVI